MAVLCAACATENRDGAKFCKGCGGKLAALTGAPAPAAAWAATAPAPLSVGSGVPAGLFDPSQPRPAAAPNTPPSLSRSVSDEQTVIVAPVSRAVPAPDLSASRAAPAAAAQSPGTPPNLDIQEPKPSSAPWLLIALVAGAVAVAAGGWYAFGGRSAPPTVPVPPALEAPAPVAPAVQAPAAVVVEPPPPAAVAPEAPSQPVVEAPAPEPVIAPAPLPVRKQAPAVRKPESAAPAPVAPPALAPAPPARTSPPPPAPVPANPEAACAGRNFIARAQCMAAQCERSEFRATSQCEAVRRQQRLEEEKRNPGLVN